MLDSGCQMLEKCKNPVSRIKYQAFGYQYQITRIKNPEKMTIRIGIINISDRASQGIYKDLPGMAIAETLNEYLKSAWEKEYAIIPDEQPLIEQTMIDMADHKKCCLIITSGGTGPAKRDVTPEATEAVCDKMMPGFGELMRAKSLTYVPTAILSRQTAGIRNKTLIVNLPGKPKAIRQCLDAVFPAIPYCIDLLEGPFIECNEAVMKPFRPQNV
jgi:molybdopterin adenylyltransferase